MTYYLIRLIGDRYLSQRFVCGFGADDKATPFHENAAVYRSLDEAKQAALRHDGFVVKRQS